MSSSSNTKTATVAEMIHRFRTAPPTSRAVREAMKQNGDTPYRMWYENQSCNHNHVEIDNLETLLLSSLSLNNDNDIMAELNSTDLPYNRKKGSNNNESWRQRYFKNGISTQEIYE